VCHLFKLNLQISIDAYFTSSSAAVGKEAHLELDLRKSNFIICPHNIQAKNELVFSYLKQYKKSCFPFLIESSANEIFKTDSQHDTSSAEIIRTKMYMNRILTELGVVVWHIKSSSDLDEKLKN